MGKFIILLLFFIILTLQPMYASNAIAFLNMQADGGAMYSCGGYHSLEQVVVYNYGNKRYKIKRLQSSIGKWIIIEADTSGEAARIGCNRYFNYTNPYAGIHIEKD